MNFSTTEPRARMHHRCYLCGRHIVPGEQHKKHVGNYEGDFYSVRAHFNCDGLTKDWKSEDFEYNDPGEFRKYVLKEKS